MIRVMLAEDSEVIRTYIKEALEKEGDILVIKECSTGIEAEMEYEKEKYDVVLMDIEMADNEDGIRAADAILSSDNDAVILYLTSHDSDETIVKAMSNGAMDYVVKGCDEDTLRKKVRMAKEGNAQIDSEIQRVLMDEYKRLRKSEKNLLYFIQNLGNLTPLCPPFSHAPFIAVLSTALSSANITLITFFPPLPKATSRQRKFPHPYVV